MRSLLLDLAAILWPTECVACGAADRDLCDPCRAEALAPGSVLEDEIGVPCFAAAPYEGALRSLLIGLKHEGRVRFARVLGERIRLPLAHALALCSSVPIIVAAPSHPARVRERGFSHVEILIACALRGQGIRHIRVRALRAGRRRSAQVGLTASERERNAQRIVVRRSAHRILQGSQVILIDDVRTTGATLRAACTIIEAAGAEVVAAVTLCAVVKRDTLGQNKVAAESTNAVEFGKQKTST